MCVVLASNAKMLTVYSDPTRVKILHNLRIQENKLKSNAITSLASLVDDGLTLKNKL